MEIISNHSEPELVKGCGEIQKPGYGEQTCNQPKLRDYETAAESHSYRKLLHHSPSFQEPGSTQDEREERSKEPEVEVPQSSFPWERTTTVTAHTGPAQGEGRQSPSMEWGNGHEVPPLAEEVLATDAPSKGGVRFPQGCDS